MSQKLDEKIDTSPSSDEEIDFGALIASLATSALLHLGESYAEDEPAALNLPMAKQSIEIIGMLREKTRGNLSVEEQQLIDEVLYDLRHRFLQVSQSST